jgi:hypothetical protein
MLFNLDNILNAYNYEALCDYSIIPPYGKYFNNEILNKNATIFCKTDYIDYLFENIKHSEFNYNIITHHSDYTIDEERWNKKPKCIKKWFAINPTVKHPNLIPIPLGLKTHKGSYLEPQYMTEWFGNNINSLQTNKKINKIYCNWNVTNLDRNNIIQQLKTNNIDYTHDYNLPFDQYITKMSEHKFVLSPIGNGIDCHRTWEALYVGCIPIVIKNYIYDIWDLPVLQVNEFSEITPKLLYEFIENKNNLKILSINFWNSMINYIND